MKYTNAPRFTAAFMLLLILCGFGIVLLIAVANAVIPDEPMQQLATLDQLFSVSRKPIPLTATDDLLIPMQVGDFVREDVIHHNESCGEDGSAALVCFTAAYRAGSGEDHRWAWIQVSHKPFQSADRPAIMQTLQPFPNVQLADMVAPYSCGDMAGKAALRTEAKIPYGYSMCPMGFIGGAMRVVAIIWENGDWFISVQGDYESFLAAFPY